MTSVYKLILRAKTSSHISMWSHSLYLLFIPVATGFFFVESTLTVDLSRFNAALKEEDFLKTI